MSTLVEAMARALSVEAEADYYRWQSSWTRLALAALKAIRSEARTSDQYNWIDTAIQEHSTTPPRNAS